MRQGFQLISSGIVPRLRITFCIIICVLIAQMAVVMYQMRTLNRSVADLTQSAVGVFLLTETTERELKNMLLLLQRANTAKSLADLAPFQSNLETTLIKLRETIAKMAKTDLSPDDSRAMATALQEIDQGAEQSIAAKKANLLHAGHLAALTDQLNRLRETMRSDLETLSFEAAQRTENTMAQAERTTDQQGAFLLRNISNDLAIANTITAITLQVDALLAKADTLQNLDSRRAIETNVQTLRFDLRNIVVLTGQLPQNPSRLALARSLSDLRSTLFSENGLVQEVYEKKAEQDRLDALLLAQDAPIRQISDLSALLNANAGQQLSAARTDLSKSARTLIIGMAFTLFISFVVIGSATLVILERQISQRMARLTKAVTSIAEGNTQYDVQVQGKDELAAIAEALDVFKVNATELHRSNQELEKFAYAAAHDLRSPLRAIQDLLEWTLEDDENVFSEDGAANMALLKNRVERLNALLSDLLEYSRVGQEEKDLIHLSIKDVVQEIADFVDPEGNFNVTYTGTPDKVLTYATPLRQILLNLISNSVKHHDQKTGSITVHAGIEQNRIQISVTDDGPGIPAEFQDRVFGLFETLKPRDEVEGSGLGLSIIRKSVEHYDGTIELHSDPTTGRGATFVFDLPKRSIIRTDLKTAA
ncbi:HAMP domain-containing sensor histidine kinase [Amylibacter sp. IMCC11727]|uniref:sensor histidine kinase n=1 Tax=Amylibacter sp. IMCC11727 TaxID=3039851 RepID=UPI00244E2852|nr:HAMP domain-containing sensor histidine kinase [Amylibacter sp. IMCC11727]WGI23077.1 HAMP domain-containing sensor histidine kinase [Amylibacter sp. IMCC11727]